MSRRKTSGLVPQDLVDRIGQALAQVDLRMEEVEAAASAPWEERRTVRRRLAWSFDDADSLLREATALTRGRSHQEWSRWRHRLSRLSLARQVMLFTESDDLPVLGLGTVRAIDTGMSGPSIGELQHGETKAPGAQAEYGLDLEAVLATRNRVRVEGALQEPAPTNPAVVAPVSEAAAPSVVPPATGRVLTWRPAVSLHHAAPVDAA